MDRPIKASPGGKYNLNFFDPDNDDPNNQDIAQYLLQFVDCASYTKGGQKDLPSKRLKKARLVPSAFRALGLEKQSEKQGADTRCTGTVCKSGGRKGILRARCAELKCKIDATHRHFEIQLWNVSSRTFCSQFNNTPLLPSGSPTVWSREDCTLYKQRSQQMQNCENCSLFHLPLQNYLNQFLTQGSPMSLSLGGSSLWALRICPQSASKDFNYFIGNNAADNRLLLSYMQMQAEHLAGRLQLFSKAAKAYELIENCKIRPKDSSRSMKQVQRRSRQQLKRNKQRPTISKLGREKPSPFVMFHTKDITKQLCYDGSTSVTKTETPKVSFPRQTHQRLIVDKPSRHLRLSLHKPQQSLSQFNPLNQTCLARARDFSITGGHQTEYRNYVRKACFKPQLASACDKYAKQSKSSNSSKDELSRTHNFNSYLARSFLNLAEQTTAPTFDVLRVDFDRIRKGWTGKADLQFTRFRDKVRTKLDRSDQQWFTKLQYPVSYSCVEPQSHSARLSCTSRRQNLVPNPYPFRANMELVPKQTLLRENTFFRQ